MKKVIAMIIILVIGASAVSFAGQSCSFDMQCGYNGVCVKRQGHTFGYCSN